MHKTIQLGAFLGRLLGPFHDKKILQINLR